MNDDMIKYASMEDLKSHYRAYKEIVDRIELEINRRYNEQRVKENNEITNSILGQFAIHLFESQPAKSKDEAWYYEVLQCSSSAWNWERPVHSKYLDKAYRKMEQLESIGISQENMLKVLDVFTEK